MSFLDKVRFIPRRERELISAASKTVAEMQAKVDRLRAKVDHLQEAVTRHQETIDRLREKLAAYDSWTPDQYNKLKDAHEALKAAYKLLQQQLGG